MSARTSMLGEPEALAGQLRVIVASPPKTGNVWIESILADLYDLTVLVEPRVPSDTPESLRTFAELGLFKDRTIFHQHFAATGELLELVESIGCVVVTTLRNPYGTFVSLYQYISRFSEDFEQRGDPAAAMASKPIDHPDVLDFLRGPFREHLLLAKGWLDSGRSQIVRYGDLHEDPVAAVRAITDVIAPVDDAAIAASLERTSADALRNRSERLAKHIWKGRADSWRDELSEVHLAIMRERHGDLVQALGYEVV